MVLWLLVAALVLSSGFFGLAGLALLLDWDYWVIGLASLACCAGAAVSAAGTARRRDWGANSALFFGGLTAVFMVGADFLYLWLVGASMVPETAKLPPFTAIVATDPVLWVCLGAAAVLPLLAAALATIVILRRPRSAAQA